MDDQEKREQPAESDNPGTVDSSSWKEDARQWYNELRGEEWTIAPWLYLEWTGEQMRVRRG